MHEKYLLRFHFFISSVNFILQKKINFMFLINIAPGANLFLIIVAILIGVAAGLTATDFLRVKAREKEWEDADADENTTGK